MRCASAARALFWSLPRRSSSPTVGARAGAQRASTTAGPRSMCRAPAWPWRWTRGPRPTLTPARPPPRCSSSACAACWRERPRASASMSRRRGWRRSSPGSRASDRPGPGGVRFSLGSTFQWLGPFPPRCNSVIKLAYVVINIRTTISGPKFRQRAILVLLQMQVKSACLRRGSAFFVRSALSELREGRTLLPDSGDE